MGQNRRVEVADTLSFLLGTWSLDRSIEDYRGGREGSFTGVGAWTEEPGPGGEPGEGGACYHESGRLVLATHEGLASRRLQVERMSHGAVMLRFHDGRPFVDLDLGPGECRRVHTCGADRYEISFVVRARSLVEERWRVRGPQKDYAAITTLAR